MKMRRKTTKRLITRKRVKIERKVREHNRKQRKLNKKNLSKRVQKREIVIPRLAPFKKELLNEIERCKAEKEREKVALAMKKKAAANQRLKSNNREADLSEEKQFTANSLDDDDVKKAFCQELRNVIKQSDVVVEVLDSRDPEGTRCKEVEELILTGGKQIILLLNKIDLIPKAILLKWLRHLRTEFPTVPFKADCSNSCFKNKQISAARVVGIDELMSNLRKITLNTTSDVRTHITVGFIGLPNVGKSSVINSMKRSRCCEVGGIPGITKCLKEIRLNKHIKLIDSPGVILLSKSPLSDLVLKNCISLNSLSDPFESAATILNKCDKIQLLKFYNLPEYQEVNEIFVNLAKKYGFVMKGGIPNAREGALKLIKDWISGRLRYYSEPPSKSHVIESEIIENFSEPINLEDLSEGSNRIFIKTAPSSACVVESLGNDDQRQLPDDPLNTGDAQMDAEGSGENNDSEDLNPPKFSLQPLTEEVISDKATREITISPNLQKNKARRLLMKKNLRRRRKWNKRTHVLGKELSEKLHVK